MHLLEWEIGLIDISLRGYVFLPRAPSLPSPDDADDDVAERVRQRGGGYSPPPPERSTMSPAQTPSPSASQLSNQVLTYFSAGPQLGVVPVAAWLLQVVAASWARKRKLCTLMARSSALWRPFWRLQSSWVAGLQASCPARRERCTTVRGASQVAGASIPGAHWIPHWKFLPQCGPAAAGEGGRGVGARG